MKRVFLGLLILFVLTAVFCACTIEHPEPTYVKPPFTGERRSVGTLEAGNLFYRIFNDDTAEVSGYDPEKQTGGTFEVLPTVEGLPVIGVANSAFEGCSAEKIVLPEGLRFIGDRAFRQSAIRSVSLPDSVTSVGEDAFDSCQRLETIEFGAGLKELPTGMFFGCGSLRQVLIPEGVEIIGEESFSSCGNLESIQLPQSLKEIGAYAFWNTGTESLTFDIPKSVSVIGTGAFRNTAWLKAQTEMFVVAGDGVLIRYNGSENSVLIPDGIKYLSDAFTGTTVERVIIPASVTGESEGAWEETLVTERTLHEVN